MAQRGLNKVMLIGNLGKDPETREMGNGGVVCNLTIATSETWKGKDGSQQEKTEWHRVTLFRQLGEIAGRYLHKGSKVYIEGKLQTRKWQDNQGNDRYTTEIVADEMRMLDPKQGNASQTPSEATSGYFAPKEGQSSGGQSFDDDMPF